MKQLTILFSVILLGLLVNAQPVFTKADTLRGSLNENRDWFDILHYYIRVIPEIENKTISGNVIWTAKAIKASKNIQIDLQQPLIIDSIRFNDGAVDKNQRYIHKWTKLQFLRNQN